MLHDKPTFIWGVTGVKKSKRKPPKRLNDKRVDYLTEQADTYGGHSTFDVMLEQIEPEPSVNCKESRTISVSLWD